MAVAADPIGSGLVASLSRPGGNVTGMTLLSNDTSAKRLQLLRDIVPAAARIAILTVERATTDDAAINAQLVERMRTAGRELGLRLIVLKVGGAAKLAAAFADIHRDQAQALFVPANSFVIDNRAQIVELAAHHGVPAMYELEGFVAVGGLLSYGPSLVDLYRRAAVFVDKILKGASPAQLPVEQPTKFRLVLNLKTAKALGLTIPPNLLARADEVIE